MGIELFNLINMDKNLGKRRKKLLIICALIGAS